jgi:ankyrin repeat protein
MPISYRAAQTLIKRNDEPGLRAALASGLDPQLKNNNGWTLLMLTAVEGHIALAQALFDKGISTNNRNAKGETALAIATVKGHTAFADFLRSKGAS